MQQTSDMQVRRQGPVVIARVFGCILAILAFLVPAELGARWAAYHTSLVGREVEIQDAATLFAKMDDLSRLPGRRIAVIGDSLVFGFAMRAAGVADWRRENLPAKLRPRFASAGADISLENLGMNGVLPADLEKIVSGLLAKGVDGIIMDVTLRSLSDEFSVPAAEYSRRWLKGFAISPAGSIVLSSSTNAFDDVVESAAINYSYLFRLREQLRLSALGQDPAELTRGLRDGLNAAFVKSRQPVDPHIEALFQAKARYAHIRLDESNLQIAALTRLVKTIAAHKIPAVIFYATERPDIIASITNPALHARRLERLQQLIVSNGGPTVRYIGPLASLKPDEFIDHVHVLPSGYEKYADAIASVYFSLVRELDGPKSSQLY